MICIRHIVLAGLFILALFLPCAVSAQLKFLLDDFEGLIAGTSDLKSNGLFTFGGSTLRAAHDPRAGTELKPYTSHRFLSVTRSGKQNAEGWGKGVGLNIELNAATDHFNFYVDRGNSGLDSLLIEFQEDDNWDDQFKKEQDDQWTFRVGLVPQSGWQLVSVPLRDLRRKNTGGDGVFNCNYKEGKFFTFVIKFLSPALGIKDQPILFDFVCFSKGPLSLPVTAARACNLGLWSEEGNKGNFVEIAQNFEKMFSNEKKLGVIHFFQSFGAVAAGQMKDHPTVDRVNKVLSEGYIPMITLENHFVNMAKNVKQPNLYSITEGHFDPFFKQWAKDIKQMKGVVLVRILHEFNGDWYPWCIVNNDRDAQLFVKAYRHIHSLFEKEGVTNMRFIWCPNSMSVPQAPWNFILDAYPGDEYVDYVGVDVYNGAGNNSGAWRSFRKEAIENYFLLTQNFPLKPLLLCETASRERRGDEAGDAQNKAEWIQEMSEALSTDLHGIKLMAWFNEKSTFKITSSPAAKAAFLKYILRSDHFKQGSALANSWLK